MRDTGAKRPWLWSLAVVPVAGVITAPADRALGGFWAAPGFQFWVVGLAALGCVAVASVVLGQGVREGVPEVAFLGAALAVLSAVSLVHALTIPGYLYGPNPTSAATGMLVVPLGLVAASPLLAPHRRVMAWLAVRWRLWVALVLTATACACGVWLTLPQVLEVPTNGAIPLVVAVPVAGGAVQLGWRHVHLYRVGRRPASLVTAYSVGYLALAAVVGFLSVPASPAWWLAHLIEVVSVLAALAGLAGMVRDRRAVSDVLAPVVARDPLVALELGLAPEVHAFVRALERKDDITRDHVVRVAELALRVAARAGLRGARLRAAGLGGLLHDIGKLVVPTDVLTKPAALSDQEFALIRTHPVKGAALVAGTEVLEPAVPVVRWHHERDDGTGYPDGRSGDEIPLEVAVVSVCDAWDALTHDRQYRAGLSRSQAMDIVRSGAGTQWRREAVDALLDVVSDAGPEASPALAAVGVEADPSDVLAAAAELGFDLLEPDDPMLRDADLPEASRLGDLADAPFPLIAVGTDGRVVDANDEAARLLGRPLPVLCGTLVLDLHPNTAAGRNRATELFGRFLAGDDIRAEEVEMQRPDGTRLWVSLSVRPVRDVHGVVVASRSLMVDVTERRLAEKALFASEARFGGVFDNTPIGMAVLDPSGHFARVNPALARMTRYAEDDLLRRTLDDLVHPDDRVFLRRAGTDDPPVGGDVRVVRSDGSIIWADLTTTTVPDDTDGTVLVVHLQDITDQRATVDELRRLALTDDLTGLHNRRGLFTVASHLLKVAARKGERATMLFVDVDRLKAINDRHGHDAGDEALSDAADVLRDTYRESDVVARIGGDEFCVLLVGDLVESDLDLIARLQRGIDAAAERVQRPYRLSLSVGVCEADASTSVATLLRRADRSMYQAKPGRRADRQARATQFTDGSAG